MMGLSFRKKLFISYFCVFLLFTVFIVPFANLFVKSLVRQALHKRTQLFVDKLKSKKNLQKVLKHLKKREHTIFIRVSIIDAKGSIFYDSHVEKILGKKFTKGFQTDHEDVKRAFEEGYAYQESFSQLLGQKLAYTSVAFEVEGKRFVIRTAFPFQYIQQLTTDFEVGSLITGLVLLVLFFLVTWWMTKRLSAPIFKIIEAITPYQKGDVDHIPEIKLKDSHLEGDFGKLARTLNSLSLKVKQKVLSLRDERNEKAAILESLIEGVIAMDSQFTLTYINAAARRILNFNDKDNREVSFEEFHQPACFQLMQASMENEQVLCEELQLVGKPNEYYEAICVPLKEKKGVVFVLQDQTQHYKMLEMKKDFIANASHELKTPITIIQGFAETLYEHNHLPHSTVKEITSKIVRHSERMEGLIKNLLLLSSVDNIESYRMQNVEIKDLVESCKKDVLSIFSDAQIEISQLNENVCGQVDLELIKLAIFNLMKNAARYSDPPAKIKVELENKGPQVRIAISDQGQGIPEKDLEKIFDRFYTVNKAHSRKLGGSGLGLAITRTIIQKHRGRIEVSSKLGEGSTFTIFLLA